MLSCSDNATNPVQEVETYQLNDYIYFDTTSFYLTAVTYDSSYPNPVEPFVFWEESLGEPFEDVNGNGVFDPGVDIFIKSIDSTNMDLNHDGYYNGPDAIWEEGIPFDDVNGDGEYLQCISPYSSCYVEGAPFYDLNHNGIWDSLSEFRSSVYRCEEEVPWGPIQYSFHYTNSQFIYTSEYNNTYIVSLGPNPGLDEIVFNKWNDSLLDWNNISSLFWDPPVYIAESGTIKADIKMYHRLNSTDSLKRETILGAELQFKDTTYSDLLLVQFRFYLSHASDYIMGFYFSKELGFLARSHIDLVTDKEKYYYYITRVDSLPLPMTR